jgi:DNA-binding NarL/FixJ family response regulator
VSSEASSSAARVRIVLADDEILVRDGLSMLLDSEPDLEVVGTAASGVEVVELAAALQPDVVVLDVRMPVMDGVHATRALTADGFSSHAHTVKVLIFSSFKDDAAVYGALRYGASGFLLKSSATGDLAAAVRTVAAGNAWLDPVVANELIKEFVARPDASVPPPEAMATLTRREREVLILLAHGLGTEEIARHLVIGRTTTKTHIGRILIKLGLRDRAQAVAVAYKAGLVRATDAPPGTPSR